MAIIGKLSWDPFAQVHHTSGPHNTALRRQVQMLNFVIQARVEYYHQMMFEKQTTPNFDSVLLHSYP